MGSAKRAAKQAAKNRKEEFMSEEEYRAQFEPVAPWKRKNIPDYGPLAEHQHVIIFIVVGIVATLVYECTDIFDEISRVFAYAAIWFPLWFRLLSRVSPAPSDEELEAREQLEFQKELDRLARAEDEVDE
uniref:Uncharacterized protein n=1 Tax=Globisporangium ultimum (strain ATCC 200006 / CBS 805.95 / DAOM BR144) TaxID=431595 RepID=K3XAM3_GLOUD